MSPHDPSPDQHANGEGRTRYPEPGPGPDGGRIGGRDAAPDALQPAGSGPPGETARPRRGGGRRGEQSMVPRAEFRDYYGRPVIKAPAWQARDIAGYFFLGGLAGAGSVFAAGAHATGRVRTATVLKSTSLGGVCLATAALIHDLGRPDRFANMLRVFRPTSPMNVGSWLLAAYGPATGAAAVTALSGRLPRIGATATSAAALLGPAVATYTAVLAADTAVPAWHTAYRELPYLFAASATAAAAGMAMVAAPPRESGPARIAAVLAASAETVAERRVARRLGTVAETLHTGRAGRVLKAARLCTTVGAALAVPAGRSRALAAVGGLSLLAGSACTRFGVFYAGIASAEDPAYTILPQRERRDAENRG